MKCWSWYIWWNESTILRHCHFATFQSIFNLPRARKTRRAETIILYLSDNSPSFIKSISLGLLCDSKTEKYFELSLGKIVDYVNLHFLMIWNSKLWVFITISLQFLHFVIGIQYWALLHGGIIFQSVFYYLVSG